MARKAMKRAAPGPRAKAVAPPIPPGFHRARAHVRMTPADMVRVVREIQELTQAELAKLSGIDQPTISSIESGRKRLGVERAERLALALKVHPAVLLFPHWEDEAPEEEDYLGSLTEEGEQVEKLPKNAAGRKPPRAKAHATRSNRYEATRGRKLNRHGVHSD